MLGRTTCRINLKSRDKEFECEVLFVAAANDVKTTRENFDHNLVKDAMTTTIFATRTTMTRKGKGGLVVMKKDILQEKKEWWRKKKEGALRKMMKRRG